MFFTSAKGIHSDKRSAVDRFQSVAPFPPLLVFFTNERYAVERFTSALSIN